jgi:hypothetical protein
MSLPGSGILAGSFYHLKKIVTYNLDNPKKALKEIAGISFNRVA